MSAERMNRGRERKTGEGSGSDIRASEGRSMMNWLFFLGGLDGWMFDEPLEFPSLLFFTDDDSG